MNKITNPCIQVCRYDKNEVCIGCMRTKEESARWLFLSAEEKEKVLLKIADRKNQDWTETESYGFYA